MSLKQTFRCRCLVLLVASGVTFNVFGLESVNTEKKDQGLLSLVRHLTEIDSIEGSFVQFSVDQKGTRIQESKGEFKAKRPGKFYWHTFEPLEQAIYSNGENITVYDPDLEQATIQKVNERIQSTPAILFSGDTNEIGNLFEVEMRRFDDVTTQYMLVPKSRDSLFERLRIRFEGKQITEMRLSDSLGQESTVSFIQTQLNVDLQSSAFEPSLPEGTDVIRDIPPTDQLSR